MKILANILAKIELKIIRISGYIKKNQLNSYGENITFYGKCYIKHSNNIDFGSNVTLNDGVYLNGLGGIKIGNDVSISAMSIIVSTALDPNTFLANKQHINKKIIIGNNVQIGAGAIILSGITIGDNVIVGAGAVVTKNIENNCIVTGSPAKILRKI